jgi:hypothetical protein
MAAVTAPRAPLTGANIVAANIFLGHMTDAFRARSGFEPLVAMQYALTTFDAATDPEFDVPFGHPSRAWDKDHAEEIVIEEIAYWGEG